MAPEVLAGVFPVLPTPFDESGAPDIESLRRLVRYLLRCGVDGITFPGVASEVMELTDAERIALARVVTTEAAGRVPVIIGASHRDLPSTTRMALQGRDLGAAALMIAVPRERNTAAAQIEYFGAIADCVPSLPLMLQNVPPPMGAGLDPAVLIEVVRAVGAITYVKEETLPSGQRLTLLERSAPPTLKGVFGGAGGRYITDELRRGAAGTMPAIELAEVHVALFAAHRAGDSARARQLFTRMLPILNLQAVFRWSLTKYVLQRRGLIVSGRQRSAGPLLDEHDMKDVDAFLGDIEDLLLPAAELA